MQSWFVIKHSDILQNALLHFIADLVMPPLAAFPFEAAKEAFRNCIAAPMSSNCSCLALYLGMANLDNSSGKFRGSKTPKHINTRTKSAMMTAVDKHRKCVPESQRYYEKKRTEGKTHNQAIRALGRQLCRIIFKMLKQNRAYEMNTKNT